MPHINDLKYNKLRQSHSGTINDMTVDNTNDDPSAASEDHNTATYEFLFPRTGVADIGTARFSYLRDQGRTGARNDQEFEDAQS